MLKRTPQEIADFTGCWVAQTPTGHWFIAKKRPLLRSYGWFIHIENRYDLPEEVVDVPEGHSWNHLYGPQGKEGKTEEDFPCSAETADSDNKQDAYSGKPADSDNKDPIEVFKDIQARHQSEVHVHQEYTVVFNMTLSSLCDFVNKHIAEGWKPQGGVTSWIGENGYRTYYQAMVRGLE